MLNIIEKADLGNTSYQDFLLSILEDEVDLKYKKAQEIRLAYTGFPVVKNYKNLILCFNDQ